MTGGYRCTNIGVGTGKSGGEGSGPFTFFNVGAWFPRFCISYCVTNNVTKVSYLDTDTCVSSNVLNIQVSHNFKGSWDPSYKVRGRGGTAQFFPALSGK